MEQDRIDAARLGDRNARGLLLRELQDPWYRLCLSMLGDGELAREAVQETAVRFLKRLPGFRGESRLMTWSMGIAINVVREMRRARARTVGEDRVAEVTPPDGEGPVEFAVAGEAGEALRAALAELPPRQREAVVLRFFEDQSVEETAAAMGCAAGTVKATIHQALRALRRKIGQMI